MRRGQFVTIAVLASLARPAIAWDGAGHMTLAAVAYRELSSAEQAQTNGILSHHPGRLDWDADYLRYRSSLTLGEYRFLRASKWPDEIKGKAGWPDRSTWHYANFPISSLTSPVRPDSEADRHIFAGLAETEETLASRWETDESRAIALAFVIHLVGDLHQPLHLATAITPQHPAPHGDAGGNLTQIRIEGGAPISLHSFWDGLLGHSKDPDEADRRALELLGGWADDTASGTEKSWGAESRSLAQTIAYPAAVWTAHGDAPIEVDGEYVRTAKAVAEHEMVLGGRRLALVLRHALRGEAMTPRTLGRRDILSIGVGALALVALAFSVGRRRRRR